MFLVTPVVPCFCYERDDSLASVGAPKLFLYGNPMSRFRISLVSCLTLLFTVSPQIQLRLVRVLEWTNFFLLCVDRACFHRLGSSAPSALRAQMINCRSTSVTSPRSPHSKILLRSEDSKSGDNLEDMSAHLDVLNLSVLKLITSTSHRMTVVIKTLQHTHTVLFFKKFQFRNACQCMAALTPFGKGGTRLAVTVLTPPLDIDFRKGPVYLRLLRRRKGRTISYRRFLSSCHVLRCLSTETTR